MVNFYIVNALGQNFSKFRILYNLNQARNNIVWELNLMACLKSTKFLFRLFTREPLVMLRSLQLFEGTSEIMNEVRKYFYWLRLKYLCTLFHEILILVFLTLNDAGGGSKWPTGQEIACHFSQDHAMVTKILDFIHKHLN